MQEFTRSGNDGEETPADGVLPPGPEETPAELAQAQLEELEREKAQFKALAQRAQADLANYRKRADEAQGELLANAAAQVILRVLPVLDDVERALGQAPPAATPEADGWLEGFRLIERKLNAVVTAEGLQRIDAEGSPFNPWEHEIVGYRDTGGRAEGDVLAVTRQGYRFNGRVLRPAQVVVQAGRSENQDEPDVSAAGKEA